MNRPNPANAACHMPPPRYLVDALFDFEALPGRYPLTLREPRALFDRSRDVLMLAAGRAMPGLAVDSHEAPRVQKAACFFVRTALLRPGADHYTLLGLEPGFHKDMLRDHYRMLIRLTHPDFVVASSAWPLDAATRINQANDVLASAASRAEYDRLRAGSTAAVRMPANSLAAVLPRPTAHHASARWRWTLGGAGLAALAIMLTLGHWSESPDDGHLTQVAAADSLSADAAPVVPAIAKPEKTLPNRQAAALKPSPAPSMKAIDASPKSPKTPAVATATTPASSKSRDQLVQAAKEAQLAKPAKAGQTEKENRAATLAQAAKEAHVASIAPAFQQAQEVSVAPAVATAVVLKPPVSTPQPAPQLLMEPSGRPSLADAQPALNRLIQAMQAGRGDELLRGLDRSVRQSSGAADLVSAYNLLVGGSGAVRLGPVQLHGRPSADQLAVEGLVQLVLHDQGPPPPVRELRLRALFAQRDGQVVMTELSTGNARP